MSKKILLVFFAIAVAWVHVSCEDDVLPKPKSYLHLTYPDAEYHRFISNCPYSFGLSKLSTIRFTNSCDAVISYPELKAQIHLSYRPVKNNLKKLLSDADKLTTKHTIKADVIIPQAFENKEQKVYGVLFDVQGQSASNVQFHVTDSTKHVVMAALYFDVQPNYDSIFPAVTYLKNDMMQMMETFEWR